MCSNAKCIRTVFILWLIAICPPFKGALADTDEDKKLVQKVLAKTDARPIAEKDAPLLYQEIRKHFEALGKAKAKLAGTAYLNLNTIHIIDDRDSTAFVVSQKEPGSKRIRSHVFISTKMIQEMMGITEKGPPPSSEYRIGMLRIVGVLAHELAHPMDSQDLEGLSRNHGWSAHQAKEIRADIEGSQIAKEAGYGENAIYEAIAQTFRLHPDKEQAFSAFVSTHPDPGVRLGAQRIRLTLQRYKIGMTRPENPRAIRPGVVRELLAVGPHKARPPFAAPKTLSETLDALAFRGYGMADRIDRLQLNRLVLTLDEQLSHLDPGNISDPDWKKMNHYQS